MKRPPKPRIVKPHLQWRWRRGAWQPFHRVTWSEGGQRKAREIKLDWRGDAAELDRLYWAAQAGRHEAQKRSSRYSWRECIEAWRADVTAGQGALALGTRRSYRRAMDAILEKNGTKDMRRTTRAALKAAVAKLSDTPREAQRLAQTASLLWNYALRELDWPLGPNPASGLAGGYKPARPFQPWPAWMVAKLDSAPDLVRRAAMVILYTGQRPGAAIAMRHDAVSGEWMTVRDEKGDTDLDVYAPPGFRDFLAQTPKRGAHIVPKNLTQPATYDAVAKQFDGWRDTLGARAKPYTLHGLRKLAVMQLAEAGASDAEIQAVTGQSAKTVAYYRAKANRKRLSKAAQERRGV